MKPFATVIIATLTLVGLAPARVVAFDAESPTYALAQVAAGANEGEEWQPPIGPAYWKNPPATEAECLADVRKYFDEMSYEWAISAAEYYIEKYSDAAARAEVEYKLVVSQLEIDDFEEAFGRLEYVMASHPASPYALDAADLYVRLATGVDLEYRRYKAEAAFFTHHGYEPRPSGAGREKLRKKLRTRALALTDDTYSKNMAFLDGERRLEVADRNVLNHVLVMAALCLEGDDAGDESVNKERFLAALEKKEMSREMRAALGFLRGTLYGWLYPVFEKGWGKLPTYEVRRREAEARLRKAFEQWEAVAAEYPGTQAALAARLAIAHYLGALFNEPERAAAAFDEIAGDVASESYAEYLRGIAAGIRRPSLAIKGVVSDPWGETPLKVVMYAKGYDSLTMTLYEVDDAKYEILERKLGAVDLYLEDGRRVRTDLGPGDTGFEEVEKGYAKIEKVVPRPTAELPGVGEAVEKWEVATGYAGDLRFVTCEVTRDDLAPGVYVVEARAPDGNLCRSLFVHSKVAAVAVDEELDTYVQVSDTKAGRPVAVSSFDGYYFAGERKRRRATEAAWKPVAVDAQPSGEGYLLSRRGVRRGDEHHIVCHTDLGPAFLTLSRPWRRQDLRTEYCALYTDKPLYHPGQTVNYKAILRLADPAERVLTPLAGTKVAFRLRDPRRDEVWTGEGETDDFGTAWGKLELASDAKLGSYYMDVTREGPLPRRWRGRARFDVEEYEKPEYEVVLTPEKDRYLSGEKVRVKVAGSYFFGGAMAGATVAYEITRWGRKGDGYESDVCVKKGEGETDVNGEYVIEWRSKYAGKYDNEYVIHVKLTDPSRREIEERTRVNTYASDRFVDFTTDKYEYRRGEPIKVRLRTFDWYDKPLAMPVRLRVYELKEDGGERGYAKGRKLYDARAKTDAEGKAEVVVALAEPPEFVLLEAEVKSSAGDEYQKDFKLRIVPPEAETAERVPELEVTVDNPRPELGEAVEITVRSRFEGVNVGVALFGTALEEYRNLTLARDPEGGYKTSFVVVADERHFPELKLAAATFHDGRFYPSWETVRPRDHTTEMDVALSFDKEEYVPADGKAVVAVSTAAPGAGPVVANLSLVAVDEALLALRRDETHAIPDAFPSLLDYHVKFDVRDTWALERREYATYQYYFYPKVTFFRDADVEAPSALRALWEGRLPDVYDWELTGYRRFPTQDRLNPQFYVQTLLSWTGEPAEALVTLTASIAGAADTGTISGLVTDQDGQPVNRALVVVKGANRYALRSVCTTTNADGYYVITPVPVGTFDVIASRIGFDEQVKSGVRVIAGLRTNLSFQLRSKFNRTDTETVIGADQIEAQVVDEFADMLFRTPGIVREDSDASTLNLHIRGGRGTEIAYIVDGLTREGFPLAAAALREEFVDLAFWEPALITDDKGQASAEIELPDNLTTWKVMALAVDRGSRVGWGGGEFNVTKHVIARLKAPRHLVVGDTAEIRTVGHNYLDVAKDMTFATSAEGLEYLRGETERRARVKPGEYGFSSAWYRALKSGKARFEAFAGTDVESDAVALEIPVVPRGTVIRHAYAGRLRDRVSHDLRITGEVDPSTFEGEIIASPSLAKTLSHGLDFYRHYPYDCIEQTLNRFLVNALLAEAAAELGLDRSHLSDGLAGALADGIGAMAEQQDESGGWPWARGGKVSVYMTAYALDGLCALRGSPFLGDEDKRKVDQMIRRGKEYLVRFLDDLEEDPERYDAELSLYVADVALRRGLVARGYDAVRDTFEYHFEHRDPKSDRGLVLLGSVAYYLGEEGKVGTVLRNLDNVVEEGPDRTLYWGEPPSACWRWWDDAVEATAKVLELKMLAEPESEQLPYIVDWLVDQRRGAVWKSTKDSAEATKALMRYMLDYPETTKPIVLTYAVNEVTGALALDPLKFENPDERAALAWGDFAPGDNKLTLERYRGEGPVFYTAAVEYYTEADQIPAVQGSVKLERKYYRVERYKKGGQMEERLRPLERPLKPGEELEVELVVNSPYDFDYAVLEDPKPAGCVNVENASRFDLYINAYVELKAEKRAVMFERLPRGETVVRYRLRAEVPGTYTALPARVYGMYSPDIGSSTASAVIEISE